MGGYHDHSGRFTSSKEAERRCFRHRESIKGNYNEISLLNTFNVRWNGSVFFSSITVQKRPLTGLTRGDGHPDHLLDLSKSITNRFIY